MPDSVIVFTDLDGTLLDHADYGFEAALPALRYLAEQNIPLVLSTSKTAAEILAMRENPVFAQCMAIVENGAGVLRAGDSQPQPEPHHWRLLQLVDELPADLRKGFSGFSSWSQETLRQHTDLDPESASRAARRHYSEPGLWLGTEGDRRRFLDALTELGIHAQQGGRFLTLGFGASKAERMRELIDERRQDYGDRVISIALGDAPNDIDMLLQSDFGIVIPNPAHAGIKTLSGESAGRIIRADAAGPAGWSDSLLTLLEDPGFPATEA